MRLRSMLLLGILLSTTASLFSEEVCPRCERIREYNAAHPENNYYYYEDYVAAQKKKAELAPKEVARKDVSQADLAKPNKQSSEPILVR